MRVGFAQEDITPPVGVELCGFGPFKRRRSNAVYEPLYAKAIAVEAGGCEAIIVACDLIGLTKQLADEARVYASEFTSVPVERIMLTCTHTHSGPATVDLIGWGEQDQRYLARLPARISEAARKAHMNLTEAEMSIAKVKADGLSYNRVYGNKRDKEKTSAPLDEDVTIFKFCSDENLQGFASYFSAHPIVCSGQTFKIHGDFVGLASNMVARENGDVVALFLQGACGDINSIYCHKPEDISLKNLKRLSDQYARILRQGLEKAKSVKVSSIRTTRRYITLEQQLPNKDELQQKIDDAKQTLRRKDINEKEERIATFQIHSCTAILQKLERGVPPKMTIELQAIRLGEIVFIAHPFELFNNIKKNVESNTQEGKVFIIGYANDYRGYAPTEDRYEFDGREKRELCYATYFVPFIRGDYSFKPEIGITLVDEMTKMYFELSS